ncbi:hypothetical protein Tco_1456310 [Tanacetum coccineum]
MRSYEATKGIHVLRCERLDLLLLGPQSVALWTEAKFRTVGTDYSLRGVWTYLLKVVQLSKSKVGQPNEEDGMALCFSTPEHSDSEDQRTTDRDLASIDVVALSCCNTLRCLRLGP